MINFIFDNICLFNIQKYVFELYVSIEIIFQRYFYLRVHQKTISYNEIEQYITNLPRVKRCGILL